MIKDPIPDLFDRAAALGISMRSIMLESGITPCNANFWQKKGGSKSLMRWLKLISHAEMRLPKAGETTWEVLGDKAMQTFRDAGYQKIELQKTWMHHDAESVENFKKVLATITKHENNGKPQLI